MKEVEFQKTEVYQYLQSLQIYAYGDLELFHSLSKNAEKKEKQPEISLKIDTHITASLGQETNADATKITPFEDPTRTVGSLSSEKIETATKPSSINPVTGTGSSTTTFQTTQSLHGSLYSPPPTSQQFRATIPFTMMMLSCMELLGYLAKKGGTIGTTEKNIKHFFTHVMLKISSADINYLVRIYRHGLTHNYFPKLNNGISYHSSNPNKSLFYMSTDLSIKTLDVNFLETCFIIGLEKISKDSSLYENIDKQYTTLVNSYKGIKPTKTNWFIRLFSKP